MGNQPSEEANPEPCDNKVNKRQFTPISESDEISYEEDLSLAFTTPIFTSARTSSAFNSSSRTSSARTSSNTISGLSKISNEMIHINRMRHCKTQSIHNGIVGMYLSSESVKTTFSFWNPAITDLNLPNQLEIGCSILLDMVAADTQIKNMFLGDTNDTTKLETISLKVLDMMGYLIRSLLRDDINLYSNIKLLGTLHIKAGVTFKMYDIMLNSMHNTFRYYFHDEYTLKVQNAMDEVFTVIARIMCNEEIDIANDINISYLKCLDECLMSLDGKSALLSYLKQCGRNNIVLFYELLNKFKAKTNDMERFSVARDIVRFNIDGIHGNGKKIYITSETTQNILMEMQKLDDLWFRNMPFTMDIGFFDGVECEVNKMILERYWDSFKESILATYY